MGKYKPGIPESHAKHNDTSTEIGNTSEHKTDILTAM